MIVSVANLGHRFDQGWLFRKVEFELEPGHKLLIKGRNGSGKSTFLKCLAGLLIPIEGEIKTKSEIGYAALDLQLYPNLTAGEHLEFAAKLRNVPPRIEELLATVSLNPNNPNSCATYSTGMRARLKLALALQADPKLLLLDEPTAALDADGRQLVDQVVTKFSGAVIYASNDDSDSRWATHVIEL